MQLSRAWDCQHNSVACLFEKRGASPMLRGFLKRILTKTADYEVKCSLNKLRHFELPTRLLRQSGVHESDPISTQSPPPEAYEEDLD